MGTRVLGMIDSEGRASRNVERYGRDLGEVATF